MMNKKTHRGHDAPFLDDEEKGLVGAFEKALDEGKITPKTGKALNSARGEWSDIVRNTAARKAITLRLQQRDIERLKVIARQKGMPYQTLVTSVLHQFVNGDLVER